MSSSETQISGCHSSTESVNVIGQDEPAEASFEQTQNQAAGQQVPGFESESVPVQLLTVREEEPRQKTRRVRNVPTVERVVGSLLLAGSAALLEVAGFGIMSHRFAAALIAAPPPPEPAQQFLGTVGTPKGAWLNSIAMSAATSAEPEIISKILQIAGIKQVATITACLIGIEAELPKRPKLRDETIRTVRLLHIARRAGAELIVKIAKLAGSELFAKLNQFIGERVLRKVERLGDSAQISAIIQGVGEELINELAQKIESAQFKRPADTAAAALSSKKGRFEETTQRAKTVRRADVASQYDQSAESAMTPPTRVIEPIRPIAFKPIPIPAFAPGVRSPMIQAPFTFQAAPNEVTLKSVESAFGTIRQAGEPHQLSFLSQLSPYQVASQPTSRLLTSGLYGQSFWQQTSHSGQPSFNSDAWRTGTGHSTGSRPITARSTCTVATQTAPELPPFGYLPRDPLPANAEPLSDPLDYYMNTTADIEQPENRWVKNYQILLQLALEANDYIDPDCIPILAYCSLKILFLMVEKNQEGRTFHRDFLDSLQMAIPRLLKKIEWMKRGSK